MADDPDRLVARAIESVLDQVPGSIDTTLPEGGATKLQPWAETAAPVGRNKRPLDELLVELAERVAADPQARATLPRSRHPALAFFDRFGRGGEGRVERGAAPGEGSSRKRRRRRAGGGSGQATQPEGAAAASPATPASGRPQGGRRRSRRGRSGGGAGAVNPAGPGGGGGATRQDNPAAPSQPRTPGSGGRRRRGRRGRGGDRPAAG